MTSEVVAVVVVPDEKREEIEEEVAVSSRYYLETDNDRIIMIVLMVLMPPLAIYFKCRGLTKHVCINLLLYLLLILPAYKHATWFCFVKGREKEAENGFVRAH